jgi:hypothetical protein
MVGAPHMDTIENILKDVQDKLDLLQKQAKDFDFADPAAVRVHVQLIIDLQHRLVFTFRQYVESVDKDLAEQFSHIRARFEALEARR